MSTLTYAQFRKLLNTAVENAITLSQEHVQDTLPHNVRYELAAFGRAGRESSLDEMLPLLYQDGTFPRIIDVAVRGVWGDCTIVWIRPSGHQYVSDVAQTWNTPAGMGPFKSVGLMLPTLIFRRPQPFARKDLEDAAPTWARAAK